MQLVCESYWEPFLSKWKELLVFERRDRPRPKVRPEPSFSHMETISLCCPRDATTPTYPPQPASMEALNLKYEEIYLSPNHCGIDERLFVTRDPQVRLNVQTPLSVKLFQPIIAPYRHPPPPSPSTPQVSTPGPAKTPVARATPASAPSYAASTPVRKAMASRPVPMPLSPSPSQRVAQRADKPFASPLAHGTSASAAAAGQLPSRLPAAGGETPVRRAMTAARSLQSFLQDKGTDG